MKVALVHPTLMDYRYELFEKLNETYDITFIFTQQGRGQNGVREQQEEIPSHWKHKVLKSNFLVYEKDPLMYLRLINELICGKYDIVITSTSRYICWVATKCVRSRFIFMTEFWYFKSSSPTRFILNYLTKHIAKKSDSIIAMGTKVYQVLLGWGVENDKIYMHPQCSVDYSKCYSLNDEKLREDYGLDNKKVILYIGRHVEQKGVEYLIEAYKLVEQRYDDVFLVIGGHGPLTEKYKSLAKTLEIQNIFFTGFLSFDDKIKFYSLCSVFVLPSVFYKNYCEPWGLVINEVMSFGKAVVTTNAVGASSDLVINGYNGYIVEEKNVRELYKALESILSSEEKVETMGKNSKEIFSKLNNYYTFFDTFNKSIKSCIFSR